MDTRSNLDLSSLTRNVQLIANAIVSFIYDIDPNLCDAANSENIECSILTTENSVNSQRLNGWLDAFAMETRYAGVDSTKLVANLHDVVQRYAYKTTIFEVSLVDYVLYNIFGWFSFDLKNLF